MIELNDWLSIDKMSGEGNTTITLNSAINGQTEQRNASIKIKGIGKEVFLNLIQYNFENIFTPYKTLISSEWSGITKTVDVYTTYENLTYEAPEWVDVSVTKNGALSTYAVTFQENSGTSIRYGKLIIKNDNETFEPIILVQGTQTKENKAIYMITDNSYRYDDVEITQIWNIDNLGFNGLYLCCLYFDYQISSIPNLLYGVSYLKAVSLPPSVTRITTNSFEHCSSLNSVDFSDNILTISSSAFAYCTSLKNFVLPSKLEVIGGSVFTGCEFNSITIPNSVTTIGDSAFVSCEELTTITFPSDSRLETIGENAFLNCRALTNINFPSSLRDIGKQSFYGCWKLTKNLSFPSNSNLQTIGESAFKDCYSITEVHLPRSLTNIGNWVFENCENLEYFELYENGATLGSYLFDYIQPSGYHTKLSVIKLLPHNGTPPIINSNTFEGIPYNGVLEYPSGSDYSSWLSLYQYYLGYYDWTGSPY